MTDLKRKTVDEYEALCKQLASDRDAKSEACHYLAGLNQTLQREVLHNQRLIMAKLGIAELGPMEAEPPLDPTPLSEKQAHAVQEFLRILKNEIRNEQQAKSTTRPPRRRRARAVSPKPKKRGRRR
jgi:hypothetical protein